MLKPGNNQLEIKVTNEWTNRLIGDRSAPPNKKILSAPPPPLGGLGPPPTLPASGLLGPVTIVSVRSESSSAKASQQNLARLCNRIAEIKIVPLKGDRGEDRVFDEFMDAGDAVVPCLITKVVDATKVQGCPICPGYAGIKQRIGDVAFFVLLSPERILQPINSYRMSYRKTTKKKVFMPTSNMFRSPHIASVYKPG